jgi:hypothetical protein
MPDLRTEVVSGGNERASCASNTPIRIVQKDATTSLIANRRQSQGL